MKKVSFTQMKDCSKEDYEFLTAQAVDDARHTAGRLVCLASATVGLISGFA
ncbi:hypothetical protein [Ruegeria arenilitoris]|uniref:hypothetical protein n=1 Tax=Ruegeria arenilitoris TaxID=1173585 RepID=UPI00148091D0|nr:hypothetical protein [Ruegeria arenilitoris]